MTTLQHQRNLISDGANEALINQLRACTQTQEILEFEEWFNSKSNQGPLSELVCVLLRNKSISRGLAAKWLSTLLKDKEEKILNYP
tara:strand:+ start:789 stop:1046 length:258 start_codon:yes stop_codon:yes gene_type:complete